MVSNDEHLLGARNEDKHRHAHSPGLRGDRDDCCDRALTSPQDVARKQQSAYKAAAQQDLEEAVV